MGGYRVTVRRGPKVERERFETLAEALAFLRARGEALRPGAREEPVKSLLGRDYEPVQIVAVRLELFGPGRLRAGVDVRGDGSCEAWTGRIRRRLLEQRGSENAWDSLERAVGGRGGA